MGKEKPTSEAVQVYDGLLHIFGSRLHLGRAIGRLRALPSPPKMPLDVAVPGWVTHVYTSSSLNESFPVM
jgi:hypothetical protein